jgi:hypothetical protein
MMKASSAALRTIREKFFSGLISGSLVVSGLITSGREVPRACGTRGVLRSVTAAHLKVRFKLHFASLQLTSHLLTRVGDRKRITRDEKISGGGENSCNKTPGGGVFPV